MKSSTHYETKREGGTRKQKEWGAERELFIDNLMVLYHRDDLVDRPYLYLASRVGGIRLGTQE